MWAICKKEWAHYFGSLSGYLIISFYLLVNGLLLFVLPNFNVLDFGYTSLQVYFDFAPWILILLIPAITMRSIAEERRTGTIEMLFTKPISDLGILLAKYLAGVTLLIIAIIPTIFYYFTMYYLGNPVGIIDLGATITSYIGLVLLGSVFVAIGIFASSLTSSQIVSFILAMFMCWFIYDGLGLLGSFAQIGDLDTIVRYLGIAFHYESIKKGVIDTSDIIYFISVIFLFLYGALTVIKTLKR